MTNKDLEERRSEDTRYKAQLPRLVEAVFYLVVSVSFGIGFIWWNEGPPMVVVERQLLTPEVRPGDKITIYNHVIATKRCPVEVTRTIVDSIGVVFSLTPEIRWPDEDVGRINYTSEVTVPLAAATGEAIYKVRAEWMCNPLQQIFTPEIALSDLEVEIVP